MPWLMKAEPDTRLEKGIDVKFSIDDFEEIGISKWDGVRNHEAKKIMKEKMKIGDEVLFYHSNCKVPGVYGLATVHKEGYPDYTAWDSAHPYFDAKSKQDSPTWYMVDVEFKARIKYPVTLALLKTLASASDLPESVTYITESGFNAIKEMALVNRGRLSVQPVTPEAYDAILLLGENGGWEDLTEKKKTPKRKSRDDVDGDGSGGPTKSTGRTGKSSEEAKTNLDSKDKKPKARAVKKRKLVQKAQNQTEASESDLSDLPTDETNDRRVDVPLTVSAEDSVPPAVAVESLSSDLRRSTRQR